MPGGAGGKALLIGCLPLLLLSGCLATLTVAVLPGGSCTPTTSVAVKEGDLPTGPIGKAGWGGEQLVNAAIIMNVAADMGLSLRDQTIGVMTAMGESSLRVIDHGDSAGPDSRGLFQQRDNGAWGSYEDRMDPARSARMFFEQLEKVDGRDDMEPTLAAHEVQRNADPYHYAPYWEDASDVVEALSGVATDMIPVNAQQCADLGSGGDPRISEDCAPVSNGIHVSACRAYAALVAEFGQFWDPLGGVGCYDPRHWDNGRGDHPVGQACDYHVSRPGTYPSQAMDARAIEVVQWIMAHHEVLDVKYIIYDEHIWNPSRDPYGPWEEVKRDHLSAAAAGVVAAHVDHIHLSTGPWHNYKGR
ncbi:hypothetical protein SAMN02745673_00925 [Marinactinospora thermotolerans DSM 45154]|uniref:ARB-07466-like C-terminal domain-containing protein n=1 Tax=Marinactinospora thermotolerans DSM 45154 TaxID=1122192 RepID=A0A1T4M348_9ACTN|nr:hypothetical protein [Marinactinospora thermotolerans]SJZ61420.1 hypothetical protein SAMN02745673_00925 [Marinactinospora thermotolerans DSM 45154]